MSNSYHSLAGGLLEQNWGEDFRITTDDDWSNLPSFQGFLGQDITTATGVDPQTLLIDSAVANDLNVIANQTNPNTLTAGGVAEFDGIPNPTIALNGSGTADAPHLIVYLDTTGMQNVRVRYDVRDLDGSTDNAIVPVALQYRIGETGNWTNVPAAFIADATSGPSQATKITSVDVTLPGAADNQAKVQIRIITANAAGSDEWIGIDNIVVSASSASPPVILDDQANVVQDMTLVVDAAHGVLANDTNGPLTVVEGFYRTAAGGQIAFDTDGSYHYVSAPGFSGTDSVEYTALDNNENVAGIGTLTLNVSAAALLPFVSLGDQLGARHQVTAGFGQVGNGVATTAFTPVPLAGGGYVVVVDYQDIAAGTTIDVRTYDANHHLVGLFDPGLLVKAPIVAALPNGGFALAYGVISLGDPNNSFSGRTVTNYVQLFDAAGDSVTGPTPVDVPGPLDGLSGLSALPNGGFVLLQSSVDNTEVHLYAQSFSASGVPESQKYVIGAPEEGRNPTILPNGQIVVSQIVNGNEVQLQRYDLHGNPVGGEIVPTSDGLDVFQARMTARPEGGFIVHWMSEIPPPDPNNPPDHPEFVSHLQIVDANGNLVGTPGVADLTFTTLFGDPVSVTSITPLANGGFVVRWRGVITDSDTVDRVQAYDANGHAVGSPIDFTSLGTFGVTRPLVYALPEGGFAIGLQSADPANHNLLIYDNNGTKIGEVRVHDTADGTGASSLFLANLANGDTLIESSAFGSVNPTDEITVQTIRFEGTTPVIQTGITFGADTTATIPVNVYIPDPDGSEIVQSLDVAGVPVGWTLTSDTATVVFDGVVWKVSGGSVTHGGTTDLHLTPARDATGSATLTVVAHTVDTDNGSQNQSFVAPFNVTVVAPTLINGTTGNDTYTVAPGSSEHIDGHGGIDTVTFGFKLVDAKISFVGNEVIVDGPNGSSHTELTGFSVYNFTDGTVKNNDGDVLVDDLFYYSQNHDVWNAHVEADAHYHSVGWKEGRDPDAFFSTSTYLSERPDVKAAGIDPLVQFHQTGWKQDTDPSIAFDIAKYFAANPDVKAANVDPLEHFLGVGAGEGRQPTAPTVLLAANGFDYVYYLQHNPDVAAAHVDPLQHYETVGWKEARNPNSLFDTNGYLAAYTDVKNAGVNPLDHYHNVGWTEGRDPSVNFDTKHYLAAYADVAAAHVDPLVHFLRVGQSEGRSPFADGHFG